MPQRAESVICTVFPPSSQVARDLLLSVVGSGVSRRGPMAMGKTRTAALLALVSWGWVLPGTAVAQNQVQATSYDSYPLEARVWLDRGQEPVLVRGDRVRVYYRTTEDAYVAIFHIDTNGTVRLAFPSAPGENHYARGGRDYRLLFPESSYWFVRDHPGMGYFFVVASPIPFDFDALRYSHYDGGWDLTQVGRQLYTDPYVAMDDYVAALIPEWEYTAYALDFTMYRVGEAYQYPRFLCYDCHGFRPYTSWNPYHYSCSTFRLTIWDSPYYYPYYRYRGASVVYVRPPTRGEPRYVFKERADGEPATPLVRTRPGTPVIDRAGIAGDPAPRRSVQGSRVAPENTASRRPTTVIPGRSGSARRPPVTTTPVIDPSRSGATRRTSPATERVVPTTPPSTTRTRPTLERRTPPPTTRSGTSTTRGGSSAVKPKRRGGGSGATNGGTGSTTISRPSARVTGGQTRTTTSGAARSSTTRGTVRSSPPRTSGSGATVRSGGSTSSRGTVTRGSSGTARTPVRSGGVTRSSGSSSGASRSTARSGGGSRSTVRSGGTTRSRGSTVRRSGGTTVKRRGGG